MSLSIFKQIPILLLILLSNSVIYSQKIVISGKVCIDSINNALSEAIIFELKTTNGTVTDINGNFNLSVTDSSLIRFSYVGCKDTIIPAKNLTNATVILKSKKNEIFFDPFCLANTLTIGYYGDINYLPFGINVNTFQPRLFILKSNLLLKTNFQSSYTFVISLMSKNLLRNNNYSLNISSEYRGEKMYFSSLFYESKDILISFENTIKNIISFSLGLTYREEKTIGYENHIGYYLAVYKKIEQIGQFVNCSYTYFENYSEYQLAIYQKLTVNNEILNRSQIGLIYNHCRKYNTLSILFRYKFVY